MKDPERRKRIQLMPLKSTVFLLLFSGGWFAMSFAWSLFGQAFYTLEGQGKCLTGLLCDDRHPYKVL